MSTGRSLTGDRRLYLRTLLGAACLAGLAACQSLPPSQQPSTSTLAGRMQLRVESADGSPDAPPAQSLSAQFELRGHSTAGELDLSSPLGSVLARAHWSPKEVWLETPKEGRIFYPDVLALSEQALGQALPLEALFDWIAGRPWPMTDSQVLDAAQEEAHAGLTGFRQLGWQVDLSQRAKGRLIFERRDPLPRVRVRLQLDDVPAAAPESAGKP